MGLIDTAAEEHVLVTEVGVATAVVVVAGAMGAVVEMVALVTVFLAC